MVMMMMAMSCSNHVRTIMHTLAPVKEIQAFRLFPETKIFIGPIEILN